MLKTIRRWLGIESRAKLVTGYGIANDATLKSVWGSASETASGIDVDSESCLGLSAVYDAVRLIAWTRAALPLPVYRRLDNQDREIVPDHPISRLLRLRPNPCMTSMVFREVEMSHLLLWGNAIDYIQRNAAGEVTALWPMHPRDVTIERGTDGRLRYNVERVKDAPTTKPVLFDYEVLHTPNFPFDGITGKSVVACAREQMGEALANQTFGAAFFGNGAMPGTVLRHPGRLSEPDRLRRNWESIHGGPKKAGKTAILEEGMDVTTIGMPLKDAQFLEGREFHVAEVARWFNLPPHKLKDLRRATFSNIAEQNIEFAQAMLPWLKRFDQEYNSKLFSAAESEVYYVEHMLDAIMEADPTSQATYFSTALQNGWMNRNEVRRKKNLNGIGEAGDKFTVQTNLIPLDRLDDLIDRNQQPEPETEDDDTGEEPDEDATTEQAARSALVDAWRRMTWKESQELIKAAKQPHNFLRFLDEFYQDWPRKFQSGMAPAVAACRALGRHPTIPNGDSGKTLVLEVSGNVLAADLEAEIRKLTDQWIAAVPDWAAAALQGEPL